ncbi:MAG: hypothetical protein M1294_01580 [Firmicutes bacterium]|uniref:Bh protein n=1 Tax=Sulfobacillus benefaciens TaxID=453960 RepID=A0A2T2X595_9FIRM|nr:hypothetical protein [Bacillota bacterium]MCL5012926.1 hypothetical protein [Bacillota bacterium]PSR29664.1 MAG: hypothetical protein C7B43_07690 [Sulfobacillus benefaciens]
MNNTSAVAELFCVPCNNPTEHVVTYRRGRIHTITCQSCGRQIHVGLDTPSSVSSSGDARYGRYCGTKSSGNLLYRIITKPRRVEEEIAEDMSGFWMGMPLRVMTKPARVLKELFVPVTNSHSHSGRPGMPC